MTETKTVAPLSPERVHLSPFERARRELYSIVGEVENQFEARGVNSDEIARGTYWLAVADHANRVVAEKHSTAETMEYGQLLRLTALAPVGFIAHRALSRLEHPSHGAFTNEDRERRQNLVGLASRYIDSLANYARSDESLTAFELNEHLCTTLEKTIELPQAATRSAVAEHVRGVQQEVAVGYLLANGLETRISAVEEDIQGADYIVRLPNSREFGIMLDVKSSRRSIAGGETEDWRDWAIKQGRLVIVSPLEETDLDGKFYPNAGAMAKKAPSLVNTVKDVLKTPKGLRRVVF